MLTVTTLLLLAGLICYLIADMMEGDTNKLQKRFNDALPVKLAQPSKNLYFTKLINRGIQILSINLGVNLQHKYVIITLLTALLLITLSLSLFSLKLVVIFSTMMVISPIIYLLYKKNKSKQMVIKQIPLFIDQVIRSLSIGHTIEAAFKLVAKETPSPLFDIINKVVNSTDLGGGFSDRLHKEAEISHINELRLIALSVKVSNDFGSSPKEMLSSIKLMINNQDEARRELAALTGETKISAIILTLSPISILLYMLVMNPDYLDLMLTSPSGVKLFWTGVGMLAIGAFLFWRMIKSI